MTNAVLNVVVLISGNGSNLQAIIDAIEAKQLNAQITCVISNKPDAYGLQRAHQHNIPTRVLNHKDYPNREAYDKDLQQLIEEFNPDLVALAGFMRILSDGIVNHFAQRMINIHPSLLPKYPGLNTHQQVIDNGDQEHGCSIHYVTTELDGGPVLGQKKLTVHNEDTPETLQQRVHQLEHKLYPEVIAWFAKQLEKGNLYSS